MVKVWFGLGHWTVVMKCKLVQYGSLDTGGQEDLMKLSLGFLTRSRIEPKINVLCSLAVNVLHTHKNQHTLRNGCLTGVLT